MLHGDEAEGAGVAGRDETQDGAGRPGGRVVAVVDVGGTTLKGAVVDAAGTVLARTDRPVADVAPGGVVEAVAEQVRRVVEAARPFGGAAAVGLAVPGLVDEAAGIGRWSLTLGWRDVDFLAPLAGLGLPVAFGHDVSSGAYAEARLGAARGHEDWLFLALGTGLGSTFVLGGRPYRGAGGSGGELAHVVVRPGGVLCRCGKRGCLETVSSGPAIARAYAAASGSALAGAADVARLAAAGDVGAAAVWDDAVDALAEAVADYVESMNPSVVVVGGGVARAGGLLVDRLRDGLHARVRFADPPPPVVAAEHGAAAALVGIAARAHELGVTGAAFGVPFLPSGPSGPTSRRRPSGGRQDHPVTTARTPSPTPATASQLEREIVQQPAVWRTVGAALPASAADVADLLGPLLDRPEARIVLTGAGTSAYAGLVVAPHLARVLGRRVEAVATTDLVSTPLDVLVPDVPTLLVSFARSGNSPESVAACDLADQVLTDVAHLVLTCNPEGALATAHRDRPLSRVVLMPPASDDESFAMTSSFTSMVLAALLLLGGGDAGVATEAAAAAAGRVLQARGRVGGLADRVGDRVVYLGSGPLGGLARECALKLTEVTAGRVVALAETSLGFRHGPKATLTPTTLALVLVSDDPYVRRYDLDILAELAGGLPDGQVVAVVGQDLADDDLVRLPGVEVVRTGGASGDVRPDAFLALPMVVVGQLLALETAVRLGLDPDVPFPGGEVNRVVQGVRVHPLER